MFRSDNAVRKPYQTPQLKVTRIELGVYGDYGCDPGTDSGGHHDTGNHGGGHHGGGWR
jgi:hypothetical protein